ncbi:MAG: hypothetical protein HC799_16640 [Limnothrix sp. RL_2_0]|nr:hypothetical protein [Limnothrix sp. RL_2_0]
MENAFSRHSQSLKSWGLAVFVAACGTVLVNLQELRLTEIKSSADLTKETVARQAIAEKNSLELWKNIPAFGYDNLLSDWVFLRFLQYFGDSEARKLGDYALSADYFDIIVEKDPWFIEGYYYLSGSSSLFAGTPDRTVDILNRGLAQMSPRQPRKGHYIWRMKAIDEHLFLGDIQASVRSYLKAAEWAGYYSDQESQDAMRRSQASAAFLVRDPRSIMAQVTAWSGLLGQSRDSTTRDRAMFELAKLGVTMRIDENGQVKFKVPPEVLEAEKEALQIQE